MVTSVMQAWSEVDAAEFGRLADEFGTPFYLYDADVVASRIRLVREALNDSVKVYYAVKANPNLELLGAIRDVADGLDISSGGELQQAATADYDMEHVSFAGPAKTRAELRASIEHGVGKISIESTRELACVIDLSAETGKRANIVLRINPAFLNRAFGIKMGGRPVQFGIDEETLPEVLKTVSENRELLDFRGIHVYSGSQCFDGQAIVESVSDTLRIAAEVERNSPLRCRTVNLGGGFGVSHSKQSEELALQPIADDLVTAFREFQAGRDAEIIFELGRYLVADAGIYVARVISTKDSRGKKFYMLDGGLHHHLAAAGTFGTALRSNFVLRNVSRPGAPAVKCNLAGPSCNPTDLLGVDVEIPSPEVGDLIGVLKSGAYGLTASPILFLGRPLPAELIREKGRTRIARPPRAILDFN